MSGGDRREREVRVMKYYLFNAKTNEYIMKCTDKEIGAFRSTYKVVHEQFDTGCDAFGNEFNFVSVFLDI